MRRLALALLVLGAPSLASAQLPDGLGPYWFGDDTARVRPSLFFQLQSRARTDDGELVWDHRIRRVRPILRASFLEDRLTSTLHLEVAPTAPELIDLYVDGRIEAWLRFRAGQFKTPFTRFYQRSLIEQAIDWPLTSRWLGGERQLGLMAHGAEAGTGLGYAVGVFAGQNRRSAFARELARAYGESLGNPSAFADPADTDPIHPELVGRLDHEGTTGPLRHTTSLSVAWDTDPVARRDYALRLAPELDLELGPVRVTAVGYLGLIEDRTETITPGVVGLLGEVAVRAHRHLELVARYARVHLLPGLVDDARAHAQAHGEDFRARHAAHEASLAVQVLLIGRSLAWQTDVAWLRAEGEAGADDDLRVRSQLQLAF